MVGMVGPDGVGKSTLMALIAGSKRIQRGSLTVLDGDMADARHRRAVCPKIAYMPQGLGKNLYNELSVRANVDFMAAVRAFRRGAIRACPDLLEATGLAPFPTVQRQAPGGMKQKVGLCAPWSTSRTC